MSPIELIADDCARNVEMLKDSLSDFSEADLFARPCKGANHTAWQLGHLIGSEAQMLGACGAPMPPLPPGFAEKYTKQTAGIDDPAAFMGKGQYLELLSKMRAAAVNWIRSLTPEQLNKPAPEPMRAYMPTVGHLVLLLPQHVAMHLGQMQAIRRSLGKPVLF